MAYVPQGDPCGAYPGPYVPPLFFRLEHKTTIYLPRNSREHTHTVILLHDRGYTPEEYGLELFETKASDGCNLAQIFPNVKWILPTFAVRRSQKDSDMEMKKWFDMWRVEDSRDREQMQRTGLRESVTFIRQLVEKELELVPSVPAENIVLGGVGQGGATAMHALFAIGLRLGGFIGLSSWMPLIEELHGVVAHIMNKERTATSLLLEDIWALALPSSGAWDEKTKITIHVESASRTPFFLAHSNNDKNAPFGHRERLRQCLASTKESSVTMYQSGEQWAVKTCKVDGLVDLIKKVIASNPKKKEVAKTPNSPEEDLSSTVERRSWSEAGETVVNPKALTREASETT
jgi:lysophospholipase-2